MEGIYILYTRRKLQKFFKRVIKDNELRIPNRLTDKFIDIYKAFVNL